MLQTTLQTQLKRHCDRKMVQRIINFMLLLLATVKCSSIEARDEKTYRNGTLVGRYQYVDAQGNQVHVKYFADGNGYGIIIRGHKPPENAVKTNDLKERTEVDKPTTEAMDTLVPLKLNFPVIENIYTIENPLKDTNDDTRNKKQNIERNENEHAQDYHIYDSGFKIPKVKGYEKHKKMKKTVRKIRQTLDSFIRKMST